MTDPTHGFTTDRAARLAVDGWGLDVVAEPLAGEFDFNFLLHARNGEKYVLKVSPVDADRESLECQIAVMRHLQGSPVAALVQRALPTETGSDLLVVEDNDGKPRWVRWSPISKASPSSASTDARHGFSRRSERPSPASTSHFEISTTPAPAGN